jgi:lipopolysaccharide export LptBFGC system permease protein LptF
VALLLQRYILRTLTRNFLLVLALLTGLVFLFLLGKSLGRHDWSLSLIASRLPFGLLVALGLSIPVSLLVGTLLTYGRLSADNEILAMRMGGVHPVHLMLPAFILGLVMTGLSLYLNGSAIPRATLRVTALTRDDLRIFLGILEEQRLKSFRSRRIKVSWSGVDEAGRLEDFFFELKPDGREKVQGEARRAWIGRDAAGEELTFRLEEVRALRGDLEDMGTAQAMVLSYPVETLFGVERVKERRGGLTNDELLFRLKRDPLLGHPRDGARLAAMRVEYWARVWLSFACLACVLIGAPVGVLLRRGSFVGSGIVAVAIILLYYPLLALSKSLAEHRVAPPSLLLAMPDIVLALLGLALAFRVVRR